MRLPDLNIENLGDRRKIALVLPVRFADLCEPCIHNAISELQSAHYLSEIVISVSEAGFAEFERVKQAFSTLSQPTLFIWHENPGIQELYTLLEERGLPAGREGLGRSCWTATGVLLADEGPDVIVFHNYNRSDYRHDLLAALCDPAVRGRADLVVEKNTSRAAGQDSESLFAELFYRPLIKLLKAKAQTMPVLACLEDRHPPGCDFAISAGAAAAAGFSSGSAYGLALLGSVSRTSGPNRVCRTRLRSLYGEIGGTGRARTLPELQQLAFDAASVIFNELWEFTGGLDEKFVEDIRAEYLSTAYQVLSAEQQHADAREKAAAVAAFAQAAGEAAVNHTARAESDYLPAWDTVFSELPNLSTDLHAIVEQDSAVAVAVRRRR